MTLEAVSVIWLNSRDLVWDKVKNMSWDEVAEKLDSFMLCW